MRVQKCQQCLVATKVNWTVDGNDFRYSFDCISCGSSTSVSDPNEEALLTGTFFRAGRLMKMGGVGILCSIALIALIYVASGSYGALNIAWYLTCALIGIAGAKSLQIGRTAAISQGLERAFHWYLALEKQSAINRVSMSKHAKRGILNASAFEKTTFK